MKIAFAALFLATSLAASAQTPNDVPAKKDEPKKEEMKKAAPKKAAPAKKPAVPKKPAAPAKPTAPPKTTIYDGKDPKAPVLRDTQGNVIPTNPNAYDVSSATGKK